jgi:hypothetical protein
VCELKKIKIIKFNMFIQTLLRASLALIVSAAVPSLHAQQQFSFVALGDLPYGPAEKSYPPYRALIARINIVSPTFSIHGYSGRP